MAYVDLGPSNGGLVVNVSERGLALFTALKMVGDALVTLSFKLPGRPDLLETQARIIWMSESKREAGVQFEGLAEEDARKISDWILGQQGCDAQLRNAAVSAPSLVSALASGLVPPPVHPEPKCAPAPPPVAGAGTPERPSVAASTRNVPARWYAEPEVPAVSRVPAEHNRPRRLLALAAIAILAFLAGLLVNRQFQFDQPNQVEESAATNAPAGVNSQSGGASLAGIPSAGSGAAPSEHKDAEIAQGTPELASVNSSAQPSTTPGADSHTIAVRVIDAGDATTRGPATTEPNLAASVPAVDPERFREETAAEQALDRASAQGPSSVSPSANLATTNTKSKPDHGGTPPMVTSASAKFPSGAVEVRVPPFPSIRIPAELRAKTPASRRTLQMGRLISRVQPEYPADALAQQVQGSVKAHVTINDEGLVEAVDAAGPPLLVEAVITALRQWRYKPTLLNGKAIPADDNLVFIFRLRSPAAN